MSQAYARRMRAAVSPDEKGELLCPSAPYNLPGSTVFGIVCGSASQPHMLPLERPIAGTEELEQLAFPARPTEVFRFAAKCQQSKCCHFDGANCRLAERIVQILPAVVNTLPPCPIRGACRWFAQEGAPACHRCPQIVTDVPHPTDTMRRAVSPV